MTTNEEAIRLATHAISIAFNEIRSLKEETEKLKVKNEVFRSILLSIYRCYAAKDPESGRLLDDHLARIHDHISGLAENHPHLKSVAGDLREFIAGNDAPLRLKFEIIEGGAKATSIRNAENGSRNWPGAGVEDPSC